MGSMAAAFAMAMEFAAPALEELLPDLSREEQLRLQNQIRERQRIWKRHNKQSPPLPPVSSERERDMFLIPQVHYALHHYNVRHLGAEFDAVKPLMECRVKFRGQMWFHINFWARSRISKKIKRFFAEVHYKPLLPLMSSFADLPLLAAPVPIVEICTIIEEPLSQYRHSCAFCPGHFDILHPKGCRKLVCGNDKDKMYQRLVNCNAGVPRSVVRPFTGSPDAQEQDQDRRLFPPPLRRGKNKKTRGNASPYQQRPPVNMLSYRF